MLLISLIYPQYLSLDAIVITPLEGLKIFLRCYSSDFLLSCKL
jgi:hypothetical protein